MSKISLTLIGLLLLSCYSTRDLTGYYRGENYTGISELILNNDNSFSFKVDQAMSTDSISGFYTIIGNRIKLINSIKNIQLVTIDKKKSENKGEMELEFINCAPGDTLIINEVKKIKLDPFYNSKFTFSCNENLSYKPFLSKEKVKIDSIECGYNYKLKLYQRSIHKIIPDTIDVRITNNKFEFQSFKLNKRKHNKGYN